MCGRFAVTTDPALLAEQIDAINEIPNYEVLHYEVPHYDVPNYNVAPTDSVAAVVSRHAQPGESGEPTRRIRLMRWGLVPPWTKPGPDGAPAAGGPLLINARADKVTTSPAYRSAAEHRRCLVPMDGYYEWRAPSAESAKTPFYLHRDGAMLFAAGLWSVWRPDRRFAPLLSVTIITTEAVGELATIHHRMPLLLPENRWDRWLDPDAPVDTALLAGPPDVAGIALRQVSTLVNSVRNNSPELIAAAASLPEQGTLL